MAACGMTTVALESTGVSWRPRFARLETRGLEVLWVDPPQVQTITGRPKRDGHDGQWRQRLPPFGLLASACRPTDQGGVLRRELRQRAMVRREASQPRPHRPKALTQRHRKLQQVGSDVTGATGRAMMRAMRAGERDPAPLARLRHDRCPPDEATIAQALHGQWRAEPRFALAQAVALSERSHQQIGACDRQSAAPLGTCAEHHDREAAAPPPPG
jgi:transposase